MRSTPRESYENKQPVTQDGNTRNPYIGLSKNSRKKGITSAMETPSNPKDRKPRRLFENKLLDSIEYSRRDMRMEGVNMELLLVNSLKINALKIQTVIENFIKDKDHTSIFCLTETKVDSLDFNPKGIKIFSKHRESKDKKGGGLIIGYKDDKKTKLEEMEIDKCDILALEGTVRGDKFRIVLTYFDSSKSKSDEDFKKNRIIQRTVENLMDVEQKSGSGMFG